jgi:hypothetical protein
MHNDVSRLDACEHGLKFAVSRYPQDTKNLVLDTKLWMILSRLDTKKISNIKKVLNNFDGPAPESFLILSVYHQSFLTED